MATKKKYHEVTVFLTADRKADKGLQSTVFLTTLSLLPLRLERRGSLLGPIQPSPFRRPHWHTHAAAAGGKRGSDAHYKQREAAHLSSLVLGGIRFLTLLCHVKLPHPDHQVAET